MGRNRNVGRRECLSRIGRIAVGLPIVGLYACESSAPACPADGQLTTPQKKVRESLKYVEKSPFGAEKQCYGCVFFRGKTAQDCAACTIFASDVHGEGYCTSWAAA